MKKMMKRRATSTVSLQLQMLRRRYDKHNFLNSLKLQLDDQVFKMFAVLPKQSHCSAASNALTAAVPLSPSPHADGG